MCSRRSRSIKLTPKRFAILFVLSLFLYLSLYTWNLKTGALDTLAADTGLQFVSLALRPVAWAREKAVSSWERYVYLVGVRQENEELRRRAQLLKMELDGRREQVAELDRLHRLLAFTPPRDWHMVGARVVAQRLGPQAALETMLVDRGFSAGVRVNTPVVTHMGVVGRVLRIGPSASTVLLLTDLNSRISVRGETHRTTGILAGHGPGHPLEARYVPQNAPLQEGEILITSGLAEIFPKGLPVARVTRIERSDISLFQKVEAEPLVDMSNLEEVLLLMAEKPAPELPSGELSAPGPANATAAGNGPAAANATGVRAPGAATNGRPAE
ncbi:MAG: rod shape-determining protein MreC [Desulfovibrionaceae bacterium]|jgi:rod shape-determining protein MreC|nr:rod shape-determining protein MreC [Desulfovibrionaceae bacterium]